MVKGWAADITPLYDKEIYIKYFERLPRFRKEKAMAQADPLKRVQSVAAWSLWEKLRKKYRLPKETVFNLSHSGEFVMCAVCMGGDLAEGKRIQVGCDIQQIGRAREHLAKRYFCGFPNRISNESSESFIPNLVAFKKLSLSTQYL